MSMQLQPINTNQPAAPADQSQQRPSLFRNILQGLTSQLQAVQEQNNALTNRVSLIEQDRVLLSEQNALQANQVNKLKARAASLKEENDRLRAEVEKGAQELAEILKENHKAIGELTRELHNQKMETQKVRIEALIMGLSKEYTELENQKHQSFSYLIDTRNIVCVGLPLFLIKFRLLPVILIYFTGVGILELIASNKNKDLDSKIDTLKIEIKEKRLQAKVLADTLTETKTKN